MPVQDFVRYRQLSIIGSTAEYGSSLSLGAIKFPIAGNYSEEPVPVLSTSYTQDVIQVLFTNIITMVLVAVPVGLKVRFRWLLQLPFQSPCTGVSIPVFQGIGY